MVSISKSYLVSLQNKNTFSYQTITPKLDDKKQVLEVEGDQIITVSPVDQSSDLTLILTDKEVTLLNLSSTP